MDSTGVKRSPSSIRSVCTLKLHAPHSPILLDPRNIQITSRGEVRLLSEQPSSDPLVVQVGRLLRAMLMGRAAPPELRLLLAQATFELPIFESIEEVERALDQLQRLEEPRIAGETLLQGVAAPRVQESTPDEDYRKPSRPILPGASRAARRTKSAGNYRLSRHAGALRHRTRDDRHRARDRHRLAAHASLVVGERERRASGGASDGRRTSRSRTSIEWT